MKYLLSTAKGYFLTNVFDISHLQGLQNYCQIHKDNGDKLIVKTSLSKMAEELGEKFFQVHKSYFVNLEKIVVFKKSGILVLNNDTEIPISRRRKDKFLQQWNKHVSSLNANTLN